MEPSMLGREGESLARSYLERKGYVYLTGNFKRAHGEIDLIMKDSDTLVFVEVKTRRNRRYGEPVESVGFTKQNHIKYGARVYVNSHHITDTPIRFDVVEILVLPSGEVKFRHTKNAFY